MQNKTSRHHAPKIIGFALTVLGVLSILYGGIVLAAGSGTYFFLVWFLLGAALSAIGIAKVTGRWQRVPRALKRVIRACVLAAAVLVVITWSLILPHFRDRGKTGADAVIVLGAQVYASGPSRVLRDRLDAAVSFLEENPDAVCVVSGCQGPNEPYPEAQGMQAYLIAHGIPEDRILMEDQARTTAENIALGMRMLEEKGIIGSGAVGAPGGISVERSGDAASGNGENFTSVEGNGSKEDSVVLVTNDFHMFRALRIAKRQGLTDVTGLSAGSPRLYLLNNMLYESAAILKNWILRKM